MEPPRNLELVHPYLNLLAPAPLQPLSQEDLREMAGRMKALVHENTALRNTIYVMNQEITTLRGQVVALQQANRQLKNRADLATAAAFCAVSAAAAPYVIPVVKAAARLVV